MQARLCVAFAMLIATFSAVAEVRAHLTLHDGKSTFVSGEPIVLDLLIESGSSPVAIDRTAAEFETSIDHIAIEPSDHVYPWKADLERFRPRWGDTFTRYANTNEFRRSLTLNDRYRFDAEGTYTVHVVTSRVQPAVASNDVTFTVVRASPEEVINRVMALERGIRQGDPCKGTRRFADELDGLPDDVATDAKLRLLVGSARSICYRRHEDGLWMARDRRRVIDRLEQAVADPAEDMPMGSTLLDVLIALKLSAAHPLSVDANVPLRPPQGNLSQPGEFDIPSENLRRGYAHVIAQTLPRRAGRSRVDSALRVMEATHDSAVPAEQDDFAAALEVLIDHFEDLGAYDIDTTIDRYETELRDPRLAPHLLKTLADPALGSELATTRGQLLRLLSRIDPDAGAAALARSACTDGPAQFSDFGGMERISTVPGADECMRKLLERDAARPDRKASFALSTVAMPFIARFSSAVLVAQVEEVYPLLLTLPDRRASHAAIAYLMRWNQPTGRRLLEAASSDATLLFDLSRFTAPDAAWFRDFLRYHLAQAPDSTSAEHAYLLGQVAAQGDEAFLADRLSTLRAEPGAAPEKRQTEAAIDQALRCLRWRQSGKRC